MSEKEFDKFSPCFNCQSNDVKIIEKDVEMGFFENYLTADDDNGCKRINYCSCDCDRCVCILDFK